ncbi:hypothetical protein AMTRI_Chr09g32740 [Amborella trichopoda]
MDSTRMSVLFLLIALCSPFNFIQSPMDFGPLNFLQTSDSAAIDFGRIFFNSPSAILQPNSVDEISLLLKFISLSSYSKVTVAARGAGHSIHGQAQAPNGIVIEMDSLPLSLKIHRKGKRDEGYSYADVSGGALWIEVLRESLKLGLAPRSWTDYLYLSVGGTLSNAGISGQTFKHGPQISNVLKLDVITGTGEIVRCSPSKRAELFYGVLGGLGQFGIITSARIVLEDAPHKVKWVRAFYDDFGAFTEDQEMLVSMADKVDYVEGFMVLNEQSLEGASVAFPSHFHFIASNTNNTSQVYYCVEIAFYYYSQKASHVEKVAKETLRKLDCIPSLVYETEVSYFDFLNRVSAEEANLRARGLWEVAHPWLNMFVPRSQIKAFKDLLLQTISPDHFEGPILIYPIRRDKWNGNTSAVLPEDKENILYIVGMLRSASPQCVSESPCLQSYLQQNNKITEGATSISLHSNSKIQIADPNGQDHELETISGSDSLKRSDLGGKLYLSYYSEEEHWKKHFGGKWERFLARKKMFDPLQILAPGQRIFKRKYSAHL